MSKMMMPEVDVVRFTESDVIVASTMILTLYNDKTAGNGSITYDGKIYYTRNGTTDFTPLYEALGGREYVVLHNHNGMNIESVFYFENASEEFYDTYYPQVEGSDGVYSWNGDAWTWIHQ